MNVCSPQKVLTLSCKVDECKPLLQVLKWAVEHDCPWSPNLTAIIADQQGHVEVARWVRAQPAQ